MAKIINLGNGYGCLKGYPSEEDPMTFPLTLSEIGNLYSRGYIDRDEAIQALLGINYNTTYARVFVATIEAG